MSSRSPLLAALIIGLLGPREARGHDGVVRSVPAKDAHLTAAPTTLRLTFNRAPTLSMVRVVLTGSGDKPVTLGTLRIDSATTVMADVLGSVEPGAYRVRWQVTGADGHPVRGEFRFTVAPGTPDTVPDRAGHMTDTGGAAPHHDPVTMPSGAEFGVQSPAYVAIRWLALTALVLMIGAIAFRFGVLGKVGRVTTIDDGRWREHVEERLARGGVIAACVVLLATMARLVAQSLALHGGAEVFDWALLRGLVLQTTWGRAWIVQVMCVVAVIWLLARPRRARWIGAAVASTAAAVAQAASGHAASVGLAAIGLDAVHVIAAAGWIGGIGALLLVAVPAALRTAGAHRFAAVAQLVRAFSPMALVCAGLVGLAGAFSAWLHLDGLADLWSSDYGRALLWKVGLLSVVAATGAYNWKRVRPTVHESVGTARLRRVAGIELGVALVVIAITAVLVATPPPGMSSAVAMHPPTR